jgi:hypothetical protein
VSEDAGPEAMIEALVAALPYFRIAAPLAEGFRHPIHDLVLSNTVPSLANRHTITLLLALVIPQGFCWPSGVVHPQWSLPPCPDRAKSAASCSASFNLSLMKENRSS